MRVQGPAKPLILGIHIQKARLVNDLRCESIFKCRKSCSSRVSVPDSLLGEPRVIAHQDRTLAREECIVLVPLVKLLLEGNDLATKRIF